MKAGRANLLLCRHELSSTQFAPDKDQSKMPRISILSDASLSRALYEDQSLPVTDRTLVKGTVEESERLGFELGSIETFIGHFAAGVHAVVIAQHLIRAAKHSKQKKLEITSPTTRVSVDLTGKSDKEVAALVRAAMPFTR